MRLVVSAQGRNCEFDVDDCATRPCQNGGSCHDLVNSFRCSCPPGTRGLLCELDDDDCASSPCLNRGTCLDRVGRYDCLCPPGYVVFSTVCGIGTIRYDTRCYFNVRSKADISQLNLPHGTDN